MPSSNTPHTKQLLPFNSGPAPPSCWNEDKGNLIAIPLLIEETKHTLDYYVDCDVSWNNAL